MSRFLRQILMGFLSFATMAVVTAAALPASVTFPLPVIADGASTFYSPIESISKAWRICVLLPHGKDKYWWGVTQGIDKEARRLGLNVGIYEAGGYDHLEVQQQQWARCDRAKSDAFIIAAISQSAFTNEIKQAVSRKKPVIDLINGIYSDQVTSRAELSFADMATEAGRYILADAKYRSIRVAWFPGPKNAGWVDDAEKGIQALFSKTNIQLIHGGYGPTDRSSQAGLIRRYFSLHSPPDYVLGNAVAIEAAASFMRLSKGRSKLVSFYASGDIVDLIRSGEVMAAPSDSPVIQARIALDLALRALEGETIPKRVSPEILMLDHANINVVDLSSLLPEPGSRMILHDLRETRR